MGDFLSNFDPGRSVRELRFWAVWLAGLTFFALCLYFCSGMHWPVWNKSALLREQIAGYQVAMPAGAKVTDASRLAWLRPRYYFRVEAPSEEVTTWLSELAQAACSRGEEVSLQPVTPTLPAPMPPDWFANPFHANRRASDKLLQLVSPRQVVWILHQPTDGRVFIAILHR